MSKRRSLHRGNRIRRRQQDRPITYTPHDAGIAAFHIFSRRGRVRIINGRANSRSVVRHTPKIGATPWESINLVLALDDAGINHAALSTMKLH
jgi:flagellar basal body P-ring protein FlgI